MTMRTRTTVPRRRSVREEDDEDERPKRRWARDDDEDDDDDRPRRRSVRDEEEERRSPTKGTAGRTAGRLGQGALRPELHHHLQLHDDWLCHSPAELLKMMFVSSTVGSRWATPPPSRCSRDRDRSGQARCRPTSGPVFGGVTTGFMVLVILTKLMNYSSWGVNLTGHIFNMSAPERRGVNLKILTLITVSELASPSSARSFRTSTLQPPSARPGWGTWGRPSPC